MNSVYPEHEIELTIDVKFDETDIKLEINWMFNELLFYVSWNNFFYRSMLFAVQ